MEFNQRIFLFLVSICLVCQPIFAFDQGRISDADEEWSTDSGRIDQSIIDSSGANFNLFNEAVICHADEVWSYEFGTVPNGMIDSSDANFTLPNEAVICHADEIWNNELAGVQLNDGSAIQQEIITGEQEWAESRSIDKQVVINAGARLTIKKGVKITFQNNGSILVNGDLLAKGTVKNPIVFNGMNGYAGRIITVGESGKADFRNAEISTSAIDGGLPPRQTAVSVSGAGILEMQACNINGNAAGIELNRVNGGNIKINRSKFFNNIVDVANNDPAAAVLPDFKWNWWGDSDGPNQSRVTGVVDSANWVAEESFRDPVVVVPGILGSWMKDGKYEIDPVLHSFDDLIAQLKAAGYVDGVDLFEFPYEWRQSNIDSARLLRDKINEIKIENNNYPKIDIVAHSMGGLVARQYIESADYQNDIDQLITIATPNNGSPEVYLIREAGDLKPGLFEFFEKNVFIHEAKENGFPDVFPYVRARISSVSQILPIYDYLYESDTGALRQYPVGYPRNDFLENLNQVEKIKKINAIEYDKIIANLNESNSTITGFFIEPTQQYPKWEHGYPVNYDILAGSRGMIKGAGDGTVPIESSQSANVPQDEILVENSEHMHAISNSRQDIIEFLLGYRMPAVGVEWKMPNLMLVQVFSPVDIQVVAADGKWVGKNISNLPVTDRIAEAYYTGYDAQAEFIAIPNPSGEYKIITQGTNTGDYSVEATVISQNNGNGQAQEATTTIQGMAVLGKVDQMEIEVSDGKVIVNSDILAPVIKINLPENGKSYLNNQILPINYQVSDNKTATDTIEVGIFLDNATTTGNVIDLAFQKTGDHALKIEAKDEAGNATSTVATFEVSASIDSIIANINRYAAMGLVNKAEKSILNVQTQLLKTQFRLLERTKNNPRLSVKAKALAVSIIRSTINSHIDIMIKGIKKTTAKIIDANAAFLLIDNLRYIKIK
ncbi:MAG: hypothetical protein L7H18_00665 [Candidatus Nealsonbacteria bacterium DGGOD1a]|nr:MAG: hypothetical protein L7H18_00665 [Candidatus Nealsonbacteria bacterium DGGOD1a]